MYEKKKPEAAVKAVSGMPAASGFLL